MQQLGTRRRLGGAAPAPALAGAALAVVLLAALLPGAADAAPAWLFPLLPHGGGKPLVIEGVACPAAVVDVPTSAAFPPAPWAASATYRLTTAGAEYVLPNGGGPLVIGVNVTVCVLGTRATLRAANNVAYFDLEGGALGLSGVALRGNGTGPSGVRSIKRGTRSTLGAADVSFEQLFAPVIFSEASRAAFRDARFVGNAGGGVRVVNSVLAFRGDTLFANNVRTFSRGSNAGLFAQLSTSVVFEGPARFLNNSVSADGVATAVLCESDCSIRFLGDAVFEDNFALPSQLPPGSSGVLGVVYASGGSRVAFEGGLSRFARNDVGVGTLGLGAGVYAINSQVLFASDTTDFVNQVAYDGAGVYASDNAVVNFARGAVRATGCRAGRVGSFAALWRNTTASFSPETTLDVDNNQAPFGQLFLSSSLVDVQSRTARFANNVASIRGGALSVGADSTLTFGPRTSVTLADNFAGGAGSGGGFGGAIFAVLNGTVAFEGGACIKNNSVAGERVDVGGGAVYLNVGSRIVFKNPPATAAGGGCGILPHPFLASKLCPAAPPQQQVMGDNSPVAAVVADSTSAIVCASNGLTRGQGSWAIEGPVCGQACVAGGGNCSCPADQPFSAAECACKAPQLAWPFPHPWLFGGKASGATSSSASSPPPSASSSSNAAKSLAPRASTKKPAAKSAAAAAATASFLAPLEAGVAGLERTKAAARP